MPSLTAVELGADTCVLARTVVRRGEISVSAVEILDPLAFPGIDSFTLALRQRRRSLRLPRRCHAVVWGLPDGAGRKDPTVLPLIEPLLGAGFRVERVVSPQNALAALARLRTPRGEGATCWLAINRGGVAIVVARPGQQMYAHSFVWDSSVGATGSQARLLQRYSLVSFLAPEVQRAMAVAREKGTPVVGLVTCGNLPDLRSLTMPLIEELDIEVETLDSLEGLKVKPGAVDLLAESAPAIRIACAGAIARSSRRNQRRRGRRGPAFWLQAAALVTAVAGLGWLWYGRLHHPAPSPVVGATSRVVPPPAANRPARAVSAPAKRPNSTAPAVSTPPKRPESTPPVVSAPPKRPESTPPVVSTPPKRPESTLPVVSAPPKRPESTLPVVSAPPKRPESTLPVVSAPAKRPESTLPVVSAPAKRPASTPPVVSAPAKRPASTPPVVSAPAKRPEPTLRVTAPTPPAERALTQAPAGADKSQARPDRPRPAPARLTDPVPRVTGLVVAADRRFATIDGGQVVSIGDLVGRRVVVAIDERTVVFREPSGVQIRVALGGRVVGVGRVEK